MGKTIDADALWKIIIGKYDSVLGLGDLMEELVNAPVVEPRKGKWIRTETDRGYWVYIGYACDQCGKSVGNVKRNYCPNCGAKMEE